jgi:hypothetical protein
VKSPAAAALVAAVAAAEHGQVAPAQRGVPCAAAVQALCPSVFWPA